MAAAGASISAPIGAETSMPSCGRARWRIGCTRSSANALESQPFVGMIEGVAAKRAWWLASESYASFRERTRMLARRFKASTSTRAARACTPFGPEAAQELENGLRYLHRPGRARAVGHQHDRPATLRLFRQCRLR